MDNCLQKVQVKIVCIYVFICFSRLPWAEMVGKYLPYNCEGKWSQKREFYRSTQYMRTPVVPPALTVPAHAPGPHPMSAPAPEMPQLHQPAPSYNSVPPVPIPRAVTDAGAPLCPSPSPGGTQAAAAALLLCLKLWDMVLGKNTELKTESTARHGLSIKMKMFIRN